MTGASPAPLPRRVTDGGIRTTQSPHPELPHHQDLLDATDWASLTTAYGTGESLPTALARLLDPDPSVRAAAVTETLGEVTHQNTVYEAAVPVALYVVAILGHPATAAGEYEAAPRSRHPVRERLLDWLESTARDADDEWVAMGEHHFGDGYLDRCPDIRALRALRPAIFSAVRRGSRSATAPPARKATRATRTRWPTWSVSTAANCGRSPGTATRLRPSTTTKSKASREYAPTSAGAIGST